MAGIDLGGHHGRRANNHEIPLIPFIDFLLCLVMFLLVTAVWSQLARVEADAKIPGRSEGTPPDDKTKELHVEVRGEREFRLVWREGSTVINTLTVPRTEVKVASGDVTYPELAQKIEDEWKNSGTYKNATDTKFDRAVLHTDNSIEFRHLLAVLDAIHRPKRDFTLGGRTTSVEAFQVSFAAE